MQDGGRHHRQMWTAWCAAPLLATNPLPAWWWTWEPSTLWSLSSLWARLLLACLSLGGSMCCRSLVIAWPPGQLCLRHWMPPTRYTTAALPALVCRVCQFLHPAMLCELHKSRVKLRCMSACAVQPMRSLHAFPYAVTTHCVCCAVYFVIKCIPSMCLARFRSMYRLCAVTTY